jgi:Sec-independent protein translocase protein TatA
VLALLNLGPGEIVLLLVLGVVLFGRDLPGVGRRVGRVVANLRRSMNDFKRQLDADESIREIRNSMQDTRRDLEQATRVPRAVANPTGALRQFATEALEQDLPEDRVTPEGAVPPETEESSQREESVHDAAADAADIDRRERHGDASD